MVDGTPIPLPPPQFLTLRSVLVSFPQPTRWRTRPVGMRQQNMCRWAPYMKLSFIFVIMALFLSIAIGAVYLLDYSRAKKLAYASQAYVLDQMVIRMESEGVNLKGNDRINEIINSLKDQGFEYKQGEWTMVKLKDLPEPFIFFTGVSYNIRKDLNIGE